MTRRRGMMRAVLGGMAAFALALGGVTAAVAAEPETDTISGTVTREDDGTPVAGVMVTASGENGGWGYTVTDEVGAYTLPDLVADSYVVTFMPDGTDLKREYWENTFDYAQATPIVVDGGGAVSGIDASLAVGGGIQGVVTREDDDTPLENVSVQALDERNEIVGATQTDASGAYDLGGLPTGSYRVRFGAPDAETLSEFWESAYNWDTATPVSIVEGQTTAGMDAALATAGYITGTVTNGVGGEPVFTTVLAYDVAERFDLEFHFTDGDGAYRIGVPAGTYKVLFMSTGLAVEWWNDAPVWDSAVEITVAAGEEVDGIDAVLDKIATVNGTVTVASDKPADVSVRAWSEGVEVTNRVITSDTGAFSLDLQKGTYTLQATATFTDGTPPVTQYFDGVATAGEATPLTLAPGDIVEGIDFVLDPDEEPEPALTLSAGTVVAGKEITVSGTGFAPGAAIAFELHSDPIALGTLTADAGGVLRGSFRIPASAPAGAHTLVALSGTTVIASTPLTVTAAAGSGSNGSGSATTGGASGALASTGSDAPVFAATGALLLLFAGLTLVRRRRTQS
ncbi:carboxypeptidase-like regulatory domain-containing protein [Microbacterium sp. K24]|uniref:MSCRAMM family protein n=1 Tax=Microbacterium sp. K24 TaxID=2305446 RepID=UPI00109D0441|nr:carboxypeptidase-like regulatory domain-containing protein [Microbacterium sp. K24]